MLLPVRREKGAAVLALQELASAAKGIDDIAESKARGHGGTRAATRNDFSFTFL